MFGVNSLFLIGIIGYMTCMEVSYRKRFSIGLAVLGLILMVVEMSLYVYLNTPFFQLMIEELLS